MGEAERGDRQPNQGSIRCSRIQVSGHQGERLSPGSGDLRVGLGRITPDEWDSPWSVPLSPGRLPGTVCALDQWPAAEQGAADDGAAGEDAGDPPQRGVVAVRQRQPCQGLASFEVISAPTPLGPTRSPPEVASAVWWRRFDVRLGNHQVGGRLVQVYLQTSAIACTRASWGDPLRLALVGRLTVPSVPCGQRT